MSSPALPHPIPDAVEIEVHHLGLIAGEGEFPLLIARAARSRSIPVTAFGLRGVTSPELEQIADTVHWVKLGDLDKVLRLCREAGITKAVMAGRIKHTAIFQPGLFGPSDLFKLAKLANKKADSVLGLVTQEFARENIEILDQALFVRSCMPRAGLLTPACPPSPDTLRDIEFGIEMARRSAGLDIGQTVVVKNLSIVAVEAMEGTDETIERAGRVAGEGIVVVKVSKPQQDRRFDLPVVGLTTVRKMAAARAAALAFPGGEVLVFNQDEALQLAAANNISVVGI